MNDSQRLANLEAIVRALRAELSELREEVRSAAGSPARAAPAHAETTPERPRAYAPPPGPLAEAAPIHAPPAPATRQAGAAAPRPRPVRAAPSIDVEQLVGRYGTLTLAVVTLVMGLGALLRWAAQHIEFGPEMRVTLGALAAAGVAGAGFWLRARGTRRFGNVLLGLALALFHVVAWGAGPYLHVVPTFVALIAADIASAALAALAWRENEEALFAVGLGGALLAPFVTSDGSGNLLALLAYGLVVLAAGVVATGATRPWRVVERLLVAGCAVYVLAALDLAQADRAIERGAPGLFAIAFAWVAMVRGGPDRRRVVVIPPLLFAALALIAAAMWQREIALEVIALAAAGAASAWSATRISPWHDETPLWLFAVLPLLFLFAALAALPEPASVTGAVTAGLWAAAALVLAYLERDARRARHLATGATAAAAAIGLGLADMPVGLVAALAAHAAAFSLILRRERAAALALPIVLALVGASALAIRLLEERIPYAYPPLLTSASLAAACAAAGWWIFAWNTSRADIWSGVSSPERSRTLVRLLGAAFTFLWIHIELAHAFSPDASTFLLIAYYALAGVGAIFAGRARGIAAARAIGLVLSLVAAAKAIVQAMSIGNVVLRVGSYALVGGFLLAVAYWYRATGEGEPAPAIPPDRVPT